MNAIPTGVVGAGPLTRALLDHAAPLGRVHLAAWAAAPDGSDADAVRAMAGGTLRDWQDIAADPAVPAIVIGATAPAAVASVALAAGKIVLCPPPAAFNDDDIAALRAAQAKGGGRLFIGGDIAWSDAGRHGLAAIRAPAFGPLRSVYLAIRQPRAGDGAGDVLDTLGWEALDFILAMIPGPFGKPRVNTAALFGVPQDTAVVLLRSTEDVVVTIELSRCLPPSLPASGLGEVEVDVFGADQSVRITPLAGAIQIHRDDGRAAAPWLNAPAVNMLRAIEAAYDTPGGPDDLDRAERAAALMATIRAATPI
jgi:predicted dehydrogenase